LEVEALTRETEKREQIVARLKEEMKDGRISCQAARRMAEEMEVSYRSVGDVCNELKIKIKACELGCF
jgi:ribosome recycling factor